MGQSAYNFDGIPDAKPAAAPPKGPQGTTGERFAEGAWRNLNPMGLVKAAAHPIDTLGAIIDAHAAEFDKARSAFNDGRYSEAVGHLAASGLPVLGPAAAHAGERMGEGDVAGGMGEAVGLVAAMQAPKAVAAAREALPTIRVPRQHVGSALEMTGRMIASPMKTAGKAVERVGTRIKKDAATSPAASADVAPARPTPVAPAPSNVAPAPAPTVQTPGPESPAAPAAPAPPSVRAGETFSLPMAQRTKGQTSGAWLANDVGIAAKRAQVPLTPQQLEQAVKTVRETGRSPLQVVQELQQAVKPKLSGSETTAFQQMVAQGKTPQQAWEAIRAMRQMSQGLPSNAVVDASVQVRNATGRWPK